MNVFFDAHPQAMFLLSLQDFRILRANRAAQKLYGYSEKEFLALKATALHPVRQVSAFLRLMEHDPLPEKEVVATTHLSAHGEPIHVEITAQSVEYEGEPIRWVCIRDLRDQREQARSLSHSHALYESLVSGLPQGVFRFVTDPTSGAWSFNYVSDHWCQITNLLREDVLSDIQNFFALFEDEHLQSLLEGFWQALRQRKNFVWESRARIRQQERVLRLEMILRQDNEQQEYWLGLLSDVTEDAALRERLKAQDLKLQKLSRRLPGALFVLVYHPENKKVLLDYLSDGAKERFGLDPDKMNRGEQLFDHILPGDLPGMLTSLNRSRETGTLFSHAFRLKPPSVVAHIWVQCEATPEKQPDGRVIWYGFLKDITEERATSDALMASSYTLEAMNEELERINADLRDAVTVAEEASTTKSQFLANMSHEIRTPMNGVLATSDLLALTELSAEQQEYVDLIRMSGQHLLGLIGNILDFSKIEAGKMELDLQDFDLSDSVEQIFGLMRAKARSRGLEAHLTLDPLPDRVRGDAVRLQQVLSNLLDNALKFTTTGRINLRVSLLQENAARMQLLFEVEDTGIGLDVSQQKHILEPFRQGDGSITRKYGGTGLGLTISQQLVRLMGGQLELESQQGVGSRFFFALEFERVAPQRKSLEHGDMGERSRRSERILVVEDNPMNQLVLQRSLEKLGYTCELADNGLRAIHALEKRSYDLVLMDCQMPEMDGYTTARNIRKNLHLRSLPIVAITANALASDRDKCLAAGMNDYISKPVTLESLEGVLAHWLPMTCTCRHESTSRGSNASPHQLNT